MKKLLITLVLIVVAIFAADKVYQLYSRHYVNSHEAVVLINERFATDSEVDQFFGLPDGTYDASKHTIIYGLERKDPSILDAYVVLPTKHKMGSNAADEYSCDATYEEVRPYRFYNYEVANKIIIARLMLRSTHALASTSRTDLIAEKQLNSSFQYGKINILIINKDGVSNQCGH